MAQRPDAEREFAEATHHHLDMILDVLDAQHDEDEPLAAQDLATLVGGTVDAEHAERFIKAVRYLRDGLAGSVAKMDADADLGERDRDVQEAIREAREAQEREEGNVEKADTFEGQAERLQVAQEDEARRDAAPKDIRDLLCRWLEDQDRVIAKGGQPHEHRAVVYQAYRRLCAYGQRGDQFNHMLRDSPTIPALANQMLHAVRLW